MNVKATVCLCAAAALLVGASLNGPATAQTPTYYRYCLMSTEYGKVTYYSAVFLDNGDYHVGMANDFHSYIQTHHSDADRRFIHWT